MLDPIRRRPAALPWAMQMRAISAEEPSRLVRSLTGAILGCGGWVLSRGADDAGIVNMLFEFERRTCVDVYSILIAAGLESAKAATSDSRNCASARATSYPSAERKLPASISRFRRFLRMLSVSQIPGSCNRRL